VTSGLAAGTQRLRRAGIEVVLLDIEGTTTPLAFVHDVLFPYSRARIAAWFHQRSPSDPQVREIVRGLEREAHESGEAPPGEWTMDDVVARLVDDIDRDRKSPALKMVQGLIWESGYTSGELRSPVYDDVPPALARWTDAGIGVGIYSSGSVLAQKLLFAHSTAGDLTPWLRWHFDTAMGAKVDAASYRRITDALRVNPSAVLFVSDVTRELEAARDAGVRTALCVRPPAVPPPSIFAVIRTFDEIDRLSLAASPSAGSR
jgi:enolase-phosphatase E1